ncbi:hypothetical protein Dgeo_2907 (plasmid) [Deinococcus geothermalis DSM 11300]|uniref:Uncharacterized protein n=1 Tax=Deinococcus geothermalis (strain DSM 11300 / CIP 105573 / AG-3a) TaxID=319795 RepID=A8ZR41_DEIGD|nr:hypothetical protein Dgeo_2907 [Deinococcus geothermalis DSM 11300]
MLILSAGSVQFALVFPRVRGGEGDGLADERVVRVLLPAPLQQAAQRLLCRWPRRFRGHDHHAFADLHLAGRGWRGWFRHLRPVRSFWEAAAAVEPVQRLDSLLTAQLAVGVPLEQGQGLQRDRARRTLLLGQPLPAPEPFGGEFCGREGCAVRVLHLLPPQ